MTQKRGSEKSGITTLKNKITSTFRPQLEIHNNGCFPEMALVGVD
ncbi:hypothetical protein MY3296_004128 [Beauveria thailandica]